MRPKEQYDVGFSENKSNKVDEEWRHYEGEEKTRKNSFDYLRHCLIPVARHGPCLVAVNRVRLVAMEGAKRERRSRAAGTSGHGGPVRSRVASYPASRAT